MKTSERLKQQALELRQFANALREVLGLDPLYGPEPERAPVQRGLYLPREERAA